MENEKTEKRKQAVEHLFSDTNLSNDLFLRTKLNQNTEGLILISTLLNCKKLKQLGVTSIDEIREAVASSTLLQVKENSIRRLDISPLPDIRLLERKRKEASPNEQIVFYLTATVNTRWHSIKQSFDDNNTNYKTIFIKFNDGHGHLIAHFVGTEATYYKEINAEGDLYTFRMLENEELIEFWKSNAINLDLNSQNTEYRIKKVLSGAKFLFSLGNESFVCN